MFLPGYSERGAGGGTNPGFPTGYGFRRTLRVSGATLGGSARQPHLPMWFDETFPGFKSTANGGNIASVIAGGTIPADVRFHAAGVKVAHEIEVYNAVTGRLAGWVDCSSLTPGTDLDLPMYYGCTGLAVSEENRAGLWGAQPGVWRLGDGQDVTGNGRHLTSSGATATTLLGMPASALGPTGYFELANPAYLNGLNAWTTVIWSAGAATLSDGPLLRIGDATASGHNVFFHPSLVAQTPATNFYGGSATFSPGGQNPRLYGATGTAGSGKATMVGFSIADGIAAALWIDGAQDTSANNGTTVATGGMSVAAGAVLRLGAGPANPTAFAGTYARLMILAGRRDQHWFRFHHANVRYPNSVYGISDEDGASDSNFSPVLGPIAIDGTGQSVVVIPVSARASEPDGDTVSAVVVQAPANGTATASAGTISYSPGSATGIQRFLVGATDGTKLARALASVLTSGGGGGGDDPLFGFGTNFTTNWGAHVSPSGGSVVQAGANTITMTAPTTAGAITDAAKLGVAIWSKNSIAGDFTAEFDYKRTDTTAFVAGGNFTNFHFCFKGDGTALRPDRIADWPSPAAGAFTGDDYYQPHAKGLRPTFATVSSSSASSDKTRLRYYDPTTPTTQLVDSGGVLQEGVFVIAPNTLYHIKIEFTGTTVVMTRTDPANVVQSFTFVDVTIAGRDIFTFYGTGTWFGLYCQARTAEISNMTIAGGGGPPGPGTEYPAARNTWTVGFGTGTFAKTTIAAAITAAGTGDHIVLAPGSYPGFALAKSGIVVRSQTDVTLAGATLDVAYTSGIDLQGDNNILWGFNLANNSLNLSGDSNTAMRFRGVGFPGDIYQVTVKGKDCRVGWCEANAVPQGFIHCAQPDASGNILALRPRIKCVYGHDTVANVANGHEIFRFAGGPTYPNFYMNGIAELCLLENVAQLKGGDNEAVSCKCHGNIMRLITLVNPGRTSTTTYNNVFINIRHSCDNLVEGCWVENPTGGIGTRDGPNFSGEGPNRIINCLVPNTGAGIQENCGNCTTAEWDDIVQIGTTTAKAGKRPCGDGTIFVGNTGHLTLGSDGYATNQEDTRNEEVYGHTGPIDHGNDINIGQTISATIPTKYLTGFVTARKVTRAEVGWAAPFGTGWPTS